MNKIMHKNKKNMNSKNNLTGEYIISESSMKLLKRNRNSIKTELYDEEYDEYYYSFILQPLPLGPHAPNKNESKTLRRICAKTGLTVEQIRAKDIYRKELSESAKIQKYRPKNWKFFRQIRNNLAIKTGMNPLNPKFYKLFVKEWNESKNTLNVMPRFQSYYDISAREAYLYSFNNPQNII